MAYVKPSNAKRDSYEPRGVPQSKEVSANAPTHNLAVRSGSGDSAQFIDIGGLWAGETKDGRMLLKGKPRDMEVLIRTPEGEFVAEQFIITAKN